MPRTTPRSALRRIALFVAVGALAVGGAAPAFANDDRDGRSDHQSSHPRLYKGRVTANGGLLLRDSPTRNSAVIRVAPYGSIVHIFCKTRGEYVEHNDRWYLLTDGTWAWGAAHYIDNIGEVPRWC